MPHLKSFPAATDEKLDSLRSRCLKSEHEEVARDLLFNRILGAKMGRFGLLLFILFCHSGVLHAACVYINGGKQIRCPDGAVYEVAGQSTGNATGNSYGSPSRIQPPPSTPFQPSTKRILSTSHGADGFLHVLYSNGEITRVGLNHTGDGVVNVAGGALSDQETEEVLKFYGNSTNPTVKKMTDGIRAHRVVQNPGDTTVATGNESHGQTGGRTQREEGRPSNPETVKKTPLQQLADRDHVVKWLTDGTSSLGAAGLESSAYRKKTDNFNEYTFPDARMNPLMVSVDYGEREIEERVGGVRKRVKAREAIETDARIAQSKSIPNTWVKDPEAILKAVEKHYAETGKPMVLVINSHGGAVGPDGFKISRYDRDFIQSFQHRIKGLVSAIAFAGCNAGQNEVDLGFASEDMGVPAIGPTGTLIAGTGEIQGGGDVRIAIPEKWILDRYEKANLDFSK